MDRSGEREPVTEFDVFEAALPVDHADALADIPDACLLKNALADEVAELVSEGVFQKAGVWYVRKCVGMINGQRCFKNIEFGDGFTFA